MRMVSAGGPYAEAIFLAYNTAVKNGFGLATAAPAPAPGEGGVRVKREAEEGVDGEIEEPTAKKARNDRTVSEETAGGDAI